MIVDTILSFNLDFIEDRQKKIPAIGLKLDKTSVEESLEHRCKQGNT